MRKLNIYWRFAIDVPKGTIVTLLWSVVLNTSLPLLPLLSCKLAISKVTKILEEVCSKIV